MPGFRVGNLGGTEPFANGRARFFCSYTWEIENLFGVDPRGAPALVYARDMTMPAFTATVEKVKGASLEYKFASGVQWEDVKIVWYDSEGLIGHLRDWRRTVWTSDQGLQAAATYKKRSLLQQFTPDATVQVRWRLFGSWPSAIRHGELTYASSDVKLAEVTVAYDWAEEDVAQ